MGSVLIPINGVGSHGFTINGVGKWGRFSRIHIKLLEFPAPSCWERPFFRCSLLGRCRENLDFRLYPNRAETFDELAELLNDPAGEGLGLGITWSGGGDAAPA